MDMEYRRVGNAGLKVSALSFGAWVTFGQQVSEEAAEECMTAAYEAGVNFFDNAQAYARGKAEEVMGRVLKKKGWRRSSYIVSTKFWWGMHDGANEKDTLNRKFLMEGIDGSLERLQLDHVDLIYAHRYDPHTTVEEVVWAMNDILASGKALYWGTSEWPAERIAEAYEVAKRLNLRKPQMEQPEYHMFARENVERNLAPLCARGLGLTTWSPLASGFLTGKYNDGIPQGTRMTMNGYGWLKEDWDSGWQARLPALRQLKALADELGCTMAQLALAWCTKNPNVSTVITGASRAEQVRENMKALEVAGRLTPEVLERIEGILGNRPEG